jgi:hypothetical protein
VQQPVIYIVNGEGDAVAVPTDGDAGLTDLGNGVKIQCSGGSGANTCSFGGHAGAGNGATVTAQMPAIYIVNNGGGGNNGSHTAPAVPESGEDSLDFMLYTADYILRGSHKINAAQLEVYKRAVMPYIVSLGKNISDSHAATQWFELLKTYKDAVSMPVFTNLLEYMGGQAFFSAK